MTVPPQSDTPTLQEALLGPTAGKWREGIKKELVKLWSNGTWKAVLRSSIPAGKKPIASKIFLKIERDPTRKTTKHTARLVCPEFPRVTNDDYYHSYGPTPNFDILRLLLTIGCHYNYEMHQMDFDASVLSSEIQEEDYIEPVPGLDPKIKANQVYKLNRTLYGLKQDASEWWSLLKISLYRYNWKPIPYDMGVYFRDTQSGREYLIIYERDLVVMSPNAALIRKTKEEMTKVFKAKDLGELTYVLGVEFKRDRPQKSIHLSQIAFIEEYLKKLKIVKEYDIPHFCEPPTEAELKSAKVLDKKEFQARAGTLLFLAKLARSDILRVASILTERVIEGEELTALDFLEMDCALGYLKSTKDLGLTLNGTSIDKITNYSSADWHGQRDNFKARVGFGTFLGEASISCRSRLQKCVSTSTLEAELDSLTSGCKELLYISYLMNELVPNVKPTLVARCDLVPLFILQNEMKLVCREKSKHMSVRFHFVRDLMVTKRVKFELVGRIAGVTNYPMTYKAELSTKYEAKLFN